MEFDRRPNAMRYAEDMHKKSLQSRGQARNNFLYVYASIRWVIVAITPRYLFIAAE